MWRDSARPVNRLTCVFFPAHLLLLFDVLLFHLSVFDCVRESYSGGSISKSISRIDGSRLLSGHDITPSADDGQRKEAAGISSANWMQLCMSLSDNISSSAAGFGTVPRHRAKTPSSIYFRWGGGHYYITSLIGKNLTNTYKHICTKQSACQKSSPPKTVVRVKYIVKSS